MAQYKEKDKTDYLSYYKSLRQRKKKPETFGRWLRKRRRTAAAEAKDTTRTKAISHSLRRSITESDIAKLRRRSK